MSDVMKGVGLAHTLAEAFDNSKACFGIRRDWTNEYINELTTKEGKENLLGPLLDVLRGDAEIVPKKRVIRLDSVRVGDAVLYGDKDDIVVLNRHIHKKSLTLGKFELGVASYSLSRFYEEQTQRHNDIPVKKTHINVPSDRDSLLLIESVMLPKYLVGKKLPGIALRDFYLENPHHIPECFSDIVLFWGTICKNDWCYYVPGIDVGFQKETGVRICTYKVVDGKDILTFEDYSITNNAAVFI